MDKTVVGSGRKVSEVMKVRVGSVRDTVKISRRFTKVGSDPLDSVEYRKASSKIQDTDGRAVFEMKDVEVPASWSQLAVDILVSKYFRKAGVPGTGHETSVRQVIRRIARTIRVEGERAGYLDRKSVV